MHQITDLAAAQRNDDRPLYAALRSDDEWPPRRACNQNCNQGRMCDCVPAVEIEDGEPRHQRAPEGAGLLIGPAIVGAVIVIGLTLHFWRAG